MLMKDRRLGIIGGMGPMAGVYFQELIIEKTPAKKDQDHIKVICYTNPKIPDRATSLQEDGGEGFVKGIVETINSLKNAGATLGIIPCVTAHTKFEEISSKASIPMLSIVECAQEEMLSQYGEGVRAGVLATTTTVQEELFGKGKSVVCVRPDPEDQQEVMSIIQGIKAGEMKGMGDRIRSIARKLKEKGADVVILGCTELSIFYKELESDTEMAFLDPLFVIASKIVKDFS